MEFETIKKNKTKQIVIGGICAISVLAVGVLATSRAKYRTTESFNIVNGTINYKVPDFKVMAMYQENDTGTYDEITSMPSSGYVINEEKTYCTTDNVTQVKGKIKSENGKITLQSLAKGDKCYLYFDKYTPPITIPDIIAGTPEEAPSSKFASVATTDEGMFSVADPMYSGTSYYYRGAVTNNYVKFAGFCWRIIRINGDGTIRMIYDGTSCHANGTSTAESIAKTGQAYNSSYNASYYVGYTWANAQRTQAGTASNLKTQTESWYKTNITDKGYDDKVAEGKFCNDRNTQSVYTWSASGSTFYYAARGRLESAKTPSLACDTGDVYTLKAGAITADEVSFAGGVYGTGNNKYYLYNGQYYWTMSPYHWYYMDSSNRWAYVFYVNTNGQLGYNLVYNTLGVRPVINLKADTMFVAGGAGTQSNPYVVYD